MKLTILVLSWLIVKVSGYFDSSAWAKEAEVARLKYAQRQRAAEL